MAYNIETGRFDRPGRVYASPEPHPGPGFTKDDGGAKNVVDPVTGGVKGQKLAAVSHIPPDALLQVAEHFGRGAQKYSRYNFRKGYAWSLSYDAMMRHALQFWGGQDLDEETGSPHLAAVAFHALALMTFMEEHPELDDRFGGPAA